MLKERFPSSLEPRKKKRTKKDKEKINSQYGTSLLKTIRLPIYLAKEIEQFAPILDKWLEEIK